ncbi:NADPH-dependent oxidoreductase [Arthrobacter psychrolactophilus]|uniref:NADPH-dependent oxidoreductase n=1 Tax=Arthrobacter psychrolactophilus TaxID=92442 RepID=A0A2V5IKV8_9MICC|nr:NAD(P)H-dependent oxidoreductase [Arthrobacter psychrolactophilus]PYI37299.1 NADPH-dependent oxidoreductase [Arthrobacter psychrolactophilus]
MIDAPLKALILVCTLSPSPKRSSSELLASQVAAELSMHAVQSETLRIVDFDVKPGVEKDMGEGDAWPGIRDKIMASDILVLATPIWVGHPSSLAQRVLERLDAELSETDREGRPILFDKVAMVAVVGNEDGAHHVIADLSQGLGEVGFSIAAQGSTYWVGEAMHTTDYQDIEQTPEVTTKATRTSARNTAHLAALLRNSPFPAG